MPARPDLVVYSAANEPELVVEVKNRRGVGDEWAETFRRSLLAHTVAPHTAFFLLVLGDTLHLWHDGAAGHEHYTASTGEVLEPYLNRWGEEPPDENSLELIVKSWLSDLTHSDLSRETAPEALSWLFDSGLYGRIRNGYVDREAVA